MPRKKMVNFVEIKEDRALALLAEERMKDKGKSYSHEEAWNIPPKKKSHGRT